MSFESLDEQIVFEFGCRRVEVLGQVDAAR